MSTIEAQRRASRNYIQKMDQITLRPTKELGAKIREMADFSGKSIQAYILDAVQREIAINENTKRRQEREEKQRREWEEEVKRHRESIWTTPDETDDIPIESSDCDGELPF